MTIAEVSKIMDISADTLRYYERIGLIPPVKRTKSGIRDYGEKDLGWVGFAKCMRGAGISIEALIEYVSLFQQGDDTITTRKQILIDQRDELIKKIEEMQGTLEYLNTKLEHYEDTLVPKERELAEE
ncbi:HTH-type transcriptional regulator AdhR [uncultured Eubacterium sp.]|uniref:MerR family transcriptional regulator n=1 Tax=Emergencia sp. TaxID=1926557 RepID=UPI00082179D3|nr:HTH-type transcriptional regulator AdhR [uncultured Eubacterium sp.]